MYFQALAGPHCAQPRATYGWLMLQCCGQPCRITEEMILQPTTTDVRGFVFLKLRTHMPRCVYRDKHYMYMQITGLLYPNTHRSVLSSMPAAHRSAIGWRRWLLMLCSPPRGVWAVFSKIRPLHSAAQHSTAQHSTAHCVQRRTVCPQHLQRHVNLQIVCSYIRCKYWSRAEDIRGHQTWHVCHQGSCIYVRFLLGLLTVRGTFGGEIFSLVHLKISGEIGSCWLSYRLDQGSLSLDFKGNVSEFWTSDRSFCSLWLKNNACILWSFKWAVLL